MSSSCGFLLVVVLALTGCTGAAASETERACRIAEHHVIDPEETIDDALALELDQVQDELVREEADELQQAAQRLVDAEGRSTAVTQQINRRSVTTEAIDLHGACVRQGLSG